MRPRFLHATLALASLAIIVPLAACGTSATTVAVSLAEWSVSVDKASVPAGEVTFNVTNDGTTDAHEMVVLKTDLAPGDLPTDGSGKVDEEGEGIVSMGEVEELEVGGTGSLTVTLQPGKYVLICNIVHTANGQTEAHYPLGMRLAFTVE
jgi:uncharacterized cupredoxin-like copper-binding protein